MTAPSTESAIEHAPESRTLRAPSPTHRRMVRNTALLFLARIGGAAAAFASQVWMARWLGPDLQGRYIEAFSWCLILADVAMFGLVATSMRFLGNALHVGDAGLARGFVRYGTIFVALSGAGFALAAFASSWILGGEPSWTLGAALLGVPFLAILKFGSGNSNTCGWYTITAFPSNLIRPGLFALFVWLGATFRWQLDTVSVALVHVALIVAVLVPQQAAFGRRMRRLLGDLGPAQPPRHEVRKWLRTGAPVLLVSLYLGFFPEVNVVLLGLHHEDAETGIFAASLRIAFMMGLGFIAVDQAALPTLLRHHAARESAALRALLLRSNLLKVAGALLGILLLWRFGTNVLALFGEEYTRGSRILLILAASHFVSALFGPSTQLLSLTGHEDRCLRVCALGLTALVVLYMSFGSSLGLEGAAWIAFGVSSSIALVMWRIAYQALGVDPSLFAVLRRSPSRV